VLRTRSPLGYIAASPFDLHVLGTPPAFILSQDQTLRQLCPLRDNRCRIDTGFGSVVLMVTIATMPAPCSLCFPITLQLVTCLQDNKMPVHPRPGRSRHLTSVPLPAYRVGCCLLVVRQPASHPRQPALSCPYFTPLYSSVKGQFAVLSAGLRSLLRHFRFAI
jgi:hypothetical protein